MIQELPHADGGLEGGPRAGGRLLRHPEAVRAGLNVRTQIYQVCAWNSLWRHSFDLGCARRAQSTNCSFLVFGETWAKPVSLHTNVIAGRLVRSEKPVAETVLSSAYVELIKWQNTLKPFVSRPSWPPRFRTHMPTLSLIKYPRCDVSKSVLMLLSSNSGIQDTKRSCS